MSYIVMWYEGEHRRWTEPIAEQATAERTALRLRERSDERLHSSYVPIRVLPLAVWERMRALETASDKDAFCPHRVTARLCERCVTAGLGKEDARP